MKYSVIISKQKNISNLLLLRFLLWRCAALLCLLRNEASRDGVALQRAREPRSVEKHGALCPACSKNADERVAFLLLNEK